MQIPLGSLTLTVTQAATRQTDAAIDAMQRGEYDVALTLAGAAEDMIKRDGSHMFASLRDSPKALELFDKKRWIATLNRERDWLKHGGDDEMEVECSAAAFMIARSMTKLDAWTPKMEAFKIWLMSNLDSL